MAVAVILVMSSVAVAIDRQANADYRVRREHLAGLATKSVVLIFADREPVAGNALWGFHQNNDFYYLTGLPEPGAAVLIVPAGAAGADASTRAYQEVLFLPKRNPIQEQWTGPKIGPDSPDVISRTGFQNVLSTEALATTLAGLGGPLRVLTDVNFDGDTSPSAAAIQGLMRLGAFPMGVAIADVNPILAELRKVKDDGETSCKKRPI